MPSIRLPFSGGVLKVFLENIIRDAVTYTEHACVCSQIDATPREACAAAQLTVCCVCAWLCSRRKTVTAMDVVYVRALGSFELARRNLSRSHCRGLSTSAGRAQALRRQGRTLYGENARSRTRTT